MARPETEIDNQPRSNAFAVAWARLHQEPVQVPNLLPVEPKQGSVGKFGWQQLLAFGEWLCFCFLALLESSRLFFDSALFSSVRPLNKPDLNLSPRHLWVSAKSGSDTVAVVAGGSG